MQSEQVVIVGGGIAGVSAAALLAQAGLPVILLESRTLGARATTRNQGWLHSGAFFASFNPELAKSCWKVMHQTKSFSPDCIDSAQSGMFFLISSRDQLSSAWTSNWRKVGIPYQDNARDTFLTRAPGIDVELVQRAFLLPDLTFRPHVLLDDLAAAARNAGAEIRTGTPVERVLLKDNCACGVLTAQGEQIAASQVVLSTGALSELDLVGDITRSTIRQPMTHRVAMKTHLISIRPDLTQVPFVFLDRHGLNHVPHLQTSVFESGQWKVTSDANDQTIDRAEMESLWKDVEMLFPDFDRTQTQEVHEWTGTTVQAIDAHAARPGIASRPLILDHETDGGPRNLWSIYPGRATLWPLLAEGLRLMLLQRMKREPLITAAPPWAI